MIVWFRRVSLCVVALVGLLLGSRVLAAKQTPIDAQIQEMIRQINNPRFTIHLVVHKARRLGKRMIPQLKHFYPLVLRKPPRGFPTRPAIFLARMKGQTLVEVMRWAFRTMEQIDRKKLRRVRQMLSLHSCGVESVRQRLLPVAKPYFRHRDPMLRASALNVILGCSGKFPKAQQSKATMWLARGFRDPSSQVREVSFQQLFLWGERVLPVLDDLLHGLSLMKKPSRLQHVERWVTKYASVLKPHLQKAYLTGSSGVRLAVRKALAWIKRNEAASKLPLVQRIKAILQSPSALASGKRLYRKYTCYVCHASSGKGLIGSNLTDRYWIFGPSPKAIYKVTANGGRSGKGMMAYKHIIQPRDMEKLVAYVFAMQKKPLKGKAPEPGAKKYPLPALLKTNAASAPARK